LFAGEKALLEFSDNDSRGGWLSGDLLITVPDKVIPSKISGKYLNLCCIGEIILISVWVCTGRLWYSRQLSPEVGCESSLNQHEFLQAQLTFYSMPALKMEKKRKSSVLF